MTFTVDLSWLEGLNWWLVGPAAYAVIGLLSGTVYTRTKNNHIKNTKRNILVEDFWMTFWFWPIAGLIFLLNSNYSPFSYLAILLGKPSETKIDNDS